MTIRLRGIRARGIRLASSKAITIEVTPRTAAGKLKDVRPGDTVIFKAGTYKRRMILSLNNLTGDESKKQTTLIAEGKVIFSQGITADKFRKKANQWADKRQKTWNAEEGKFNYPSLVAHIKTCHLMLEKCANVVIKGFKFEQSWPTHIFIDDCRDIEITKCKFLDGTFAIAAEGHETYGIEISHCTWRQDRKQGHMWHKIPWWRMHGAEGDGYPPVDIKNDWRMFDGDFFRGFEIRGGVHIHECNIAQAFNAIHLFNRTSIAGLCVDVNVHNCDFKEIRDNVLEAEKCAENWWFWHNTVENAHKPLSLEIQKGGRLYIFGNKFWFNSIQGPAGFDAHRGGGMFKLAKKSKNSEVINSYVFHNSMFIRADYMRKGQLEGLNHFNNAIKFAQPDDPDEEKNQYVEDLPEIFGNLSAHPNATNAYKFRFTNKWQDQKNAEGKIQKGLGISFENDLIHHESWPDIIEQNGYPLTNSLPSSDPMFRDNYKGKFDLATTSPCLGKSIARKIILPDGTKWDLNGGQNIGAVQDDGLIVGPDFLPLRE